MYLNGAAADQFTLSCAGQQEINAKFSKSRFASEARAEDLDGRRQTVLSTELLGRAAMIDRELSEALRRRQNSAATEKLSVALKIVEKVAAEYPRSRYPSRWRRHPARRPGSSDRSARGPSSPAAARPPLRLRSRGSRSSRSSFDQCK
jgi:hypothetical protein